LMTVLVFKLTRRRGTSWIAGVVFVTAAIVTEAVSGVVGIADVLGGLGALLALLALTFDLTFMPIAVFLATLFGLYSKESALCLVPLIPFAALVTAQTTHPRHPRRWIRMFFAALATFAAFVLYVEARRRMFPAPIGADLSDDAIASKHGLAKIFAKLLKWYAQPALPRDPINNPLVLATPAFRIAGALRVYASGLGQVLFPWWLSGDYSAPQEPIPAKLIFPASVIGALGIVLPIIASVWLAIASAFGSLKREPDVGRGPIQDVRPILAVALMWIVISYFPVSNVPVLLPTVRAERFWYFPMIGWGIVFALTSAWLLNHAKSIASQRVIIGVVSVFLVFQCFCARRHANDYKDDLTFWDATRRAVPRSAKAHLNYSVMQGARGNLEERLSANRVALQLSPDWPMASIYLGDTLCRLHRPAEAWPYYAKGFELAPNDKGLIGLALQCLWDEHALASDSKTRDDLDEIVKAHPGSWIESLGRDILENGEKHNGVDPINRPRGYNEGPKD
jgi:tetratricopeptide (TPR) repeat protein